MKKGLLIFALLGFFSLQTSAQTFSFSGIFGLATPLGESFDAVNGKKIAGGGFSYTFDGLYHLEQTNNKLGVGLCYSSSLLTSINSNIFDTKLYVMTLYGVKSHYTFLDSNITPFVALCLGLSQFPTPQVSVQGQVTREAMHSYGFGTMPEVGLYFGEFVLSAAYLVPVKYSITKKTAGNIQYKMGYRHYINR